MIVVIQCAATKQPDAGCLNMPDGTDVVFVADPSKAPPAGGRRFAHPDGSSPFDGTWREHLLTRRTEGGAKRPLLPAYRLYVHPVYERLAERFGIGSLCILSAGWGLLSAEFATPYYDITFSQSAEPYKRRRPDDQFNDFRMLPQSGAGPIVFVGGKQYVALFCELTAGSPHERIVFYNSAMPPAAPDCTLQRYRTTTRTNWHYECATALIRGDLAGVISAGR